MSKQILSEQATAERTVRLVESANPHPGCLGTIYGICADFKNKTRNGNFYSRKLWENVFNDALVKESLEDRILFGELGHPAERLETDIAKACIVMTDYEFDDNDGTIKGHFDILDTPCGRIFKSLLDYGCRCGLSSRGEGDVVEESGQNNIDEDTYYFVGFDAVALPAVKKAKPSLQESVKRETLKESIRTQVASINNKSVLETVRKVIETADLPEFDPIMESINTKASELEGITDSSNLIDDLANLTRELEETKQENIRLKESVITYKDRLNKAVKSCKVSSDDSAKEQKSLNESIQQKDAEITKFKIKLREANSRYIESQETIQKITEDYEAKIDSLIDEHNAYIEKTEKAYNESINKINDSNERKLTRLQESYERDLKNELDNTDKKISEKDSEIASLNKTIFLLKDKIKALESVRSSQEEEQTTLNENLNTQLSEANAKISTANKKVQALSKSYNDLLESYVSLKTHVSGVSRDLITDSLKPNSTAKEVDSLVESIVNKSDRYRSMSSLSDPLFSTTGVKTNKQKGNDENDTLRSFMGQAMKML